VSQLHGCSYSCVFYVPCAIPLLIFNCEVHDMAGSLKWFIYTTDRGDDFALKLDESNTEALNGANQDFLNNATTVYALPRNITPRKVFYASADGSRVISCVALTTTIYDAAPTANRTITDPIAGAGDLSIVRIRGEKITLPFGQDTGITDGDDT